MCLRYVVNLKRRRFFSYFSPSFFTSTRRLSRFYYARTRNNGRADGPKNVIRYTRFIIPANENGWGGGERAPVPSGARRVTTTDRARFTCDGRTDGRPRSREILRETRDVRRTSCGIRRPARPMTIERRTLSVSRTTSQRRT